MIFAPKFRFTLEPREVMTSNGLRTLDAGTLISVEAAFDTLVAALTSLESDLGYVHKEMGHSHCRAAACREEPCLGIRQLAYQLMTQHAEKELPN